MKIITKKQVEETMDIKVRLTEWKIVDKQMKEDQKRLNKYEKYKN